MIQPWAYLAISLVLTACGGGSDNSASSSDQAQITPGVAFTRVLNQSTNRNTVETYAVGDLNSDGLDDVVVGGWTGGTNYLAIMIQNPNGTLTDRTVALAGTNQYPGSNHVFIGDFDHDGHADIWFPGDDDLVASTSSLILWGSTSGVFVRQTVDSGVHSQGACVTDLNQDGHVDVLIMGTYNQNINTYGYYLNNGNRTFSPLVASLHVNGGSACAVIRDAATEAAWTEGVRKGREAIEKKVEAARKAMGVRKNEPNPSGIRDMKEKWEFEMMMALRKEVLGK